MDRRDILLAAGGIAVATSAHAALADDPHAHHHVADTPLIDAALGCRKAGEICQAHCFDLLADGDKSVAACARSTSTLIAVCHALVVLAAERSPLLPRYAAVTADACKACEDECKKHADRHAPCKACADACAACATECAKLAA